jgi:S-adenosylmethionine:tRNA ribosyltransferase-isomerase
VRTSDFDYELPSELIAQAPLPNRDDSRLLVLDRSSGQIAHERFTALPNYLQAGDVLVLNDSRVLPASLRGAKANSGGAIEVLLLEQVDLNDWWVLLRPGKRVRPGSALKFHDRAGNFSGIEGTVISVNAEGHRRIRFTGTANILRELERIGEIPLPPYIHRVPHENLDMDRERYQTIYAQTPGSVAAPTAGLHFSRPLIEQIRQRGVNVQYVTLHVGLGTFAPVKSEEIEQHRMHAEYFEVSSEAAEAMAAAKREGGRVFAVGTTPLRALETVAEANKGKMIGAHGGTNIFIYPPRHFRVVDALITNFHLPKSTLLMLASAFAAPGETRGRDLIMAAYQEAVRRRYRFFSYGDAMLIL